MPAERLPTDLKASGSLLSPIRFVSPVNGAAADKAAVSLRNEPRASARAVFWNLCEPRFAAITASVSAR
jgi:hypothetical protein